MARNDAPTPEDAGKHFRIDAKRRDGDPLGKPDAFEDVLRRQRDRGPQRQAELLPPPRRLQR